MLNGSNGVIADSLEPMREQMKKELLGYLQKHGIEGVNSYTDDIFGTNSNFTQLSGFKTTRKRGGHRNVKAITRLIADAIGNAVGKGMPQELLVTSEQGKSGLAFNTGTFYKEISKGLKQDGFNKVYQKADVTSFEVFNAEYDIYKMAMSIFEKDGFSQESYNKFISLLEEAAKNGSSQIFQVSTNVKRMINMAKEAEGIPALSMEKLIFMLNNTVEGCIAENEIEGLTSYIAAVCAAWMWDDYTDLFSLSENGSSIQKIRMFNSGGMYYSASQIIGKTVEELINGYNGSSFVVVDIKPPVFDADGMYDSLMEKYPIPKSSNVADWQAALAPRWDAMRDYVSSHGTISIKLQQQGLEKLIGNLSRYL